ncbi:MAG TPA: hypothetical protein PLR37_07930 [Candidatus Accumulibacter phosphatis]|jgi:hypothetical protein|nr:hypothetical protein [Candidatus Accumulibacter phosphatis]
MMVGIEEAYCNTLIRALLLANYALLEATISEALQRTSVWGKGDTLGLDAIPEIAILECLKSFDQYAIMLTEESGQDANPLARTGPQSDRGARTFFICDPTDRSAQLRDYLLQFNGNGDPARKVAEAFKRPGYREEWETAHGGPCSITGALSAITCVRRGLPICSAFLNYITQELFVACSAGVYRMTLPPHDDIDSWQTIDFERVQSSGKAIHFRQVGPEYWKRFVTFLGKEDYRENLLGSKFINERNILTDLHYDKPGGPSRVLYLSELQPADHPIGFVLANGEKIGEWIHWFAFCRFAISPNDLRKPALQIYEVSEERPYTKDGILMSPSPAYSIFKVIDPVSKKVVLDVDRLEDFPNPSRYRGMLLLAVASNQTALQNAKQHGHRAIEFFGP